MVTGYLEMVPGYPGVAHDYLIGVPGYLRQNFGKQGPNLDTKGPHLGNQGPLLGNKGQT